MFLHKRKFLNPFEEEKSSKRIKDEKEEMMKEIINLRQENSILKNKIEDNEFLNLNISSQKDLLNIIKHSVFNIRINNIKYSSYDNDETITRKISKEINCTVDMFYKNPSSFYRIITVDKNLSFYINLIRSVILLMYTSTYRKLSHVRDVFFLTSELYNNHHKSSDNLRSNSIFSENETQRIMKVDKIIDDEYYSIVKFNGLIGKRRININELRLRENITFHIQHLFKSFDPEEFIENIEIIIICQLLISSFIKN